jgi:TetR/AcrR family transcriptional regulator
MVRARAAQAGGSEPDSRERILNAALRIFAERGFEGATTRDIAARAGVNQGLIKYYFDGKLPLWRAAVNCAFEELRATIADTLGDATPIDETERTRRLIKQYVRFVAAHPEFIRMMHDEGKRSGPRMRWLVDRHIRPLHSAITAMLERAQQQGLLPADIPAVHFHYVMIGSVGLIFHQAEECKRLAGVDPTDQAVADAHADAVALLLLGPPIEEIPA